MNILAKILNMVKRRQKDIFLGFCIILISVIGFNLGKLNASRQIIDKTTEKVDVYQKTKASVLITPKPTPAQPKDLRVVASKASSSKKYHFSWCPGAKKIKEINKLWFENESLAQKAGYTLAGNCQ